MKSRVLTVICSALEYLLDRGELECLTEVETKVRYTSRRVPDDGFIVKVGRKHFRITAEEVE